MKTNKIVYWAATGVVAAGMIMSAYMYLTGNLSLVQSFQQLGYPDYFITILGTAKLLGAIALVVPVSERVKEWAYAGFAFTFAGAVWTHLATGTPWIAPLVALIILVISYWSRMKLLATKSSDQYQTSVA